MSARWCGVTSTVTGSPSAFADAAAAKRRGGGHVQEMQARTGERRKVRCRGSPSPARPDAGTPGTPSLLDHAPSCM